MTLSISRRAFLSGVASVAAAPLVPALPVAAAQMTVGAEVAAGPDGFVMWAVGTPGEYDWQAISARSAEEAYRFYREEHGLDELDEEEDWSCIGENVERVPSWDGKSPRELTGADWFKANFGYHCSKCGFEASPDNGARCVEGAVYCEECMTLPLKILDDPDDAFDLLVNDIAVHGEDEMRGRLLARKEWDGVPADMWVRACEEARKP